MMEIWDVTIAADTAVAAQDHSLDLFGRKLGTGAVGSTPHSPHQYVGLDPDLRMQSPNSHLRYPTLIADEIAHFESQASIPA